MQFLVILPLKTLFGTNKLIEEGAYIFKNIEDVFNK